MLQLPEADPKIVSRKAEIVSALCSLISADDAVIDKEDELRPFETDGLAAYRQMPLAVVLPSTTEEISAVLKYCNDQRVNVVARGAGTSLAGGALPLGDAVILGVSKMKSILEIDYDNRTATVQAGVTNINITNAVSPDGFFYAPDPSSQLACTIAGNIGMNSGGAHCLKYGVTTNNVLGLKVALMDGSIVEFGGKHLDANSYDLMGLFIGSEGMMGVVTEITVRILRSPEGARPVLVGFNANEDAGACVAAIIASGIIPVAIEFMDRPAIHAAENFTNAGYPLDVEAMLIIEVEGSDEEIDDQLGKITSIAKDFNPVSLKVSYNETESAAIWKGRKSAFGAVGQISPDYLCMDGTIPTSRLPEVLKGIQAISDKYGLQVANIFHAGDGNLHPLVLYNGNKPGELERVEEMGAEILQLCVDVGGCLTGEHGVGIEKRDLMPIMFNKDDLDQMKRLKSVFDPQWLLNPAKVFPLEDGQVAKMEAA